MEGSFCVFCVSFNHMLVEDSPLDSSVRIWLLPCPENNVHIRKSLLHACTLQMLMRAIQAKCIVNLSSSTACRVKCGCSQMKVLLWLLECFFSV